MEIIKIDTSFTEETPTEESLTTEQDSPKEGKMTGARLESLIKQLITDEVRVNGKVISFQIRGADMACIYDERADRMRIISPIIPASEVTNGQAQSMMEANFHRALDARYATSHGMVYAAFIHPLSSLHPTDLQSAIYQVYSARVSFGNEYSSGLFSFGENDLIQGGEGHNDEDSPSEIR